MKNHLTQPSPNGNRDSIEEPLIHVLCVDDETVFLKSAKQILELQEGFHVETASSVKEAHQKMMGNVFDVVVSDYQMPEKNGLDFLRELRESGNEIPFILFTGKGREEVAVKALNLGADRYFNKIGHPETVYGELAHGIRQAVAQRRAEQEIWDREERLRAIIASSPDAMIVTDLHGTVTDCNLETLNLLEVSSRSDVVGKDCYALLVNEDQRKVRDAIKELFECGFINNLECRLLTESGCEIPVDFSANILRDAYGNPIGAVGLARGITDRKRMGNRILQQNEFLNSALEALTHPFYVIGADDYTIQLANSATGFDNLGANRTCYQVTHKRKKPCSADYPCPLEIVKKTKKPVVTEHIHIDKNGNRRNVEVHGYPIFDNEGNVVQMIESSLDITERKKAEQEIKESEKKYRSLFENMLDGFAYCKIVLDEKGKPINFVYLEINDAFEKLTGLKKENVLGKKVSEAIPGTIEAHPELFDIYGRVALTGKPEEFEIFFRPLDIWLSISVCSPKKGYFVAVFENITEKKKAEDALRESEKRFRELSELLPEVIFETDSKGVLSFVNHVAYTRFGYSREDFDNGLKALQMLVPEDRDRGKENIGKVLCGEKTGSNEYTAIRKDGSTFPIIINSTPITRGDRTVGIRGVIVDITERKQMENAIREGEEKLRTLLDTANVLVQSVDANGNFVYVNKEWMKILGYSDKDFKNLTLMDIIRSDHHKYCMDIFKQVINEKAVQDIETVFVSKDGQEIMVRGNAKAIFRDGKFISTVGFFLDITERKKAEDTLKETLTKLETLNEKLGVVGKLTRHDVRNKLSVIVNNVYLAKQRLAGDQVGSGYLEGIESAVNNAEKILNFASNYEKLGVEELSYIDVGKCVEEAVMLLSGLDEIRLVNECHDLTVLADSLLRQLVYNLMHNSVVHGERVDQISVYYKEGKDQLKLIYEDNGVGIPEADKEKIFMEGYGKGTGYGLYLIKKTCEAYGWVIHETGVPDKGAQFTIAIPKTSYMLKEP